MCVWLQWAHFECQRSTTGEVRFLQGPVGLNQEALLLGCWLLALYPLYKPCEGVLKGEKIYLFHLRWQLGQHWITMRVNKWAKMEIPGWYSFLLDPLLRHLVVYQSEAFVLCALIVWIVYLIQPRDKKLRSKRVEWQEFALLNTDSFDYTCSVWLFAPCVVLYCDDVIFLQLVPTLRVSAVSRSFLGVSFSTSCVFFLFLLVCLSQSAVSSCGLTKACLNFPPTHPKHLWTIHSSTPPET